MIEQFLKSSYKVLVIVAKVMFAHCYSSNNHKHAKGESYALLKSLVLSRRQTEATDGYSGVMPAESSWFCNGETARVVADCFCGRDNKVTTTCS